MSADVEVTSVARSPYSGVFTGPVGGCGSYLPLHINVQVLVQGRRFEFARYQGGAWEVYDHPKAWKGTPRFVGNLPTETGAKLMALALDWWTRTQGENFYLAKATGLQPRLGATRFDQDEVPTRILPLAPAPKPRRSWSPAGAFPGEDDRPTRIPGKMTQGSAIVPKCR